MRLIATFVGLLCSTSLAVDAFVTLSQSHRDTSHRDLVGTTRLPSLSASLKSEEGGDLPISDRRSTLLRLVAAGGALASCVPAAAVADDDEESFASIAAKASKITKELGQESPATAVTTRTTDKTAYDFSLPVEGQVTPFSDIIRQATTADGDMRVKAILVVNIKQDDTIARKTIPGLISLASKYGRGDDGALAVLACPTDQGYYEPDTSQLIRLKLASEYGYGINPSTQVTDKVNLLGSGAHPFWRWLESNCRTPAGLGRIEGNFEKFLIDGRTGLPLRRYPRRYAPSNIAADIEAVIAGKTLPPAGANWMEEWRAAAAEAKDNTYRFEKGLNYYE